MQKYKAIISSDWNECLAPCGPFDYIAFNYPALGSDLENHFRRYTAGKVSLKEAVDRVNRLLPEPVSRDQMDDYLENAFTTYKGVQQLMKWCLSRDIYFMVNTTGPIGYFQRVFAAKRIPCLPAVSAFPQPVYPGSERDSFQYFDLSDIADKGRNTERAARFLGVPFDKVIVMGDSGGDGPHFKWGRENGAFLIASMAKSSLDLFCESEDIHPDVYFGPSYRPDEAIDRDAEMACDFMELTAAIETALNNT